MQNRSTTLTAATYRDELGGGLIRRWSTAADTERIACLVGLVHRRSEEEPPNLRSMDGVRRQMRGDSPLMGPGDFAVVEDTAKPDKPIVACACLWRHEWAFEGIPFSIGRPETVATHPGYRRRGLMRALFGMLHARSEAEGHRLQAITGIPYFYRQFGYEYALDLGGRRVVYLSLIPRAKEGETEPYALRDATAADIPLIAALYERRCAGGVVRAVVTERDWQHKIQEWAEAVATGEDISTLELHGRLMIIVDATGEACGWALLSTRRYGRDLQVYALELDARVSLPAALPGLLRALRVYGLQVPTVDREAEPLSQISLSLGAVHPVYEALGRGLAPYQEPPYAWYVRVPDLPAFLRHIGPALEQRLAASVAAGYSGELRLDFYRGGLRLAFDGGQLTDVEPWQRPVFGPGAQAGFPPLVFCQLLFGRRSLDDLRYAFPDVWASSEAELLLNALFPRRPSWVLLLR